MACCGAARMHVLACIRTTCCLVLQSRHTPHDHTPRHCRHAAPSHSIRNVQACRATYSYLLPLATFTCPVLNHPCHCDRSAGMLLGSMTSTTVLRTAMWASASVWQASVVLLVAEFAGGAVSPCVDSMAVAACEDVSGGAVTACFILRAARAVCTPTPTVTTHRC